MTRHTTTDPMPTAFLDHVVIMLDGQAHGALQESDFLRQEFGRFKVKTANSSLAKTYTSAGLAGVNTLLEFFDVAAPPLPDLIGALVFSFPVPGSIDIARRRLEERLGCEVPYELVRRTVVEGQEPLPWYHLLRPNFGDKSPFILMLAEGVPEYFSEQLGAQRGEGGEMHRKAYLEAALGESHGPDRLLRDVDEVTVRLNGDRAETLGHCLEALGFVGSEQGDVRVYRGVDATLRVLPAGDLTEGVVAVGAALQRPSRSPRQWSFGESSQLQLGQGHRAQWSFTPPQRAV